MSIGHWIIVIVSVGVYFTPSIVAWVRRAKPHTRIAFLNLLLGWTILGWVGALVWAVVAEKHAAASPAGGAARQP